jgi:hypothetical protein
MNRALTRGAVPYKARSVAWYDPLTGEILDERDEQVVKVQPHASVVEVLRTVRARMLYLLPDETGRYPERSWFTGCIEIGCKIDKYLSKTHSVTISRGEKVIDIHPVGQYFDTAPSTTVPLKTWDGSTGSLPRCKSPTKKEPEKPFRTAYTGLSGAVVLTWPFATNFYPGLSRSFPNRLSLLLHRLLRRIDQSARERKRSEEEVHVHLRRGRRQLLESVPLRLDLLCPLLLQVVHALGLLCEELHPAQEDVLSKLQVVILKSHQTVCNHLAGLTKGINHIPAGLLDLLELLVVCHCISPCLCLCSQVSASVHE